MHYRPEIDGLRALAVLAVIAFHAGLPGVTGGYFGVDVFFVISGFVIGSVLLAEINAGQFSLSGFFMRRIRRLAPALLVVMAATMLAGWFLMMPWEFEKLGRSGLAVLGIYANFHFMKATDYFSPDAEHMPLLHTWSLSIEEQLYLVLPALLLLAARFRLSKRWIVVALAVVIAASFALAAFYPYKLASTRFYSTGTRAWELFAGVLLAFCLSGLPKLSSRLSSLLSGFGLAAIIVAFLAFDLDARVPGFASLLPVAGTVILLAVTKPEHLAYRVLAHPALVAVGVASYSAYLWHQPILAFGRIQAGTEELRPIVVVILLIIVALMSFLSYRFIEAPFRNRARTTNLQVLATVLASVLALACVSQIITQTRGLSDNFMTRLQPEQALRVKALADAIGSRGPAGMRDDGGCQLWQEKLTPETDLRVARCAQQFGTAIVVLGDSHAMDLFNALKAVNAKPFMIGLSRGACGPLRIFDDACPFQAFKSFVARNQSIIERVLVTQSGNFFNAGKNINETAVASLQDYLKSLSIHVPLLWVGPHYEPGVILERLNPLEPFGQFIKVAAADDVFFLDKELAARTKQNNVEYFSKLLATYRGGAADFIVDGTFSYSDTDHWSTAGEAVFGKRLLGALQAQGYLKP